MADQQRPAAGRAADQQRPAEGAQAQRPAGAEDAQAQRPAGAEGAQAQRSAGAEGAQAQRSAEDAQAQRPASAEDAQAQRSAGGRVADLQRSVGGVALALRTAGAAALGASVALCLFELLRALWVAPSSLGGPGFAAALWGTLGLPAAALGLGLWLLADLVRWGWRWSRAGGGPVDGVRVAAWSLFGLVALATLVLSVTQATILFTRWFKRPIYQGLGAGLVAAGVVLVWAALAGFGVGASHRLFGALRRRLPVWVDPTRRRGALVWLVGIGLFVAWGLPALWAQLHTVDLRPARLLLGWLAVLVGIGLALRWRGARPARRTLWLGAGLLVASQVGALVWAAQSLGERQDRKVALERDTLLASPALGALRRLGDADRDGVSRWFGGGDCDDGDPMVRPGVFDDHGDGIDQNCSGADLDLADDPLRAPVRAVVGARQDWHVVLLTVDALRHDTARAHMPQLQALAAESQDYRHAYSHGAATYWSLPALMQSTMPSRLHLGKDQTPVPESVLFTEILRDQGWATALFANVTIFFVRGLRQGAQVADYKTSDFTVHGAKPGSEHLTDGLLAHADRFLEGKLPVKRDRMFVWAHYYDPHDPYFEVPGFPAADGSDQAKYEAIARYLDVHLGRLVQGLKDRGLWDRTLLIITADHGDEFLDHGHRFHGATLYEEMVHVPLIVRVPGLPGRVHETPIGHMEVVPSVLELLGLPADASHLGRSRAQEMRTGQAAAVEPVFFEVVPDSNYSHHQVGMRWGDLKLIYRVNSHSFELYDLAQDPQERRNVYDTHPQMPELRAQLMRYLDHHLYWLALDRTGAKRPQGSPTPPPAMPEVRLKRR